MATRPRSRVPHSLDPTPPAWIDVLASIEDAVVAFDQAGRIVAMNPAAEQLTGLSAPQALGGAVTLLLGPGQANAWIGELVGGVLRDAASRRRAEEQVVTRFRATPVSGACSAMLDSDGQLRGAVLVLHDLTMRRALDETTRRADRLAALGTVALGLAHEIRNPLGGIKGAAQLLRGAVSDPDLVRCTDVIIREVDRLDGLVEQLRGLSVRPQLLREPLNIHRVLNDVLALERQAPAWGEIAVRTDFDPSLPPVLGDRAQLMQVFLNLVKNAVEALGGAGDLVVSTQIESHFHIRRGLDRDRLLTVRIHDSGPGVAPEHEPQLFAPFFTTKGGGTGLGLALCHRIVTEHGGTIAYERPDPGGACFRVTLPVCEDHGNATG